MLTKCANPSCSASFRFLHSGKLFHFEAALQPSVDGTRPHRPGEMFWLCENCAAKHTLASDGKRGVRVVPLSTTPRERALPTEDTAIAV